MDATFLLVGDNGHVDRLDDAGGLNGALAQLATMSQRRIDKAGQVRWSTHGTSLKLLERHFDSSLNQARADALAIRGDAFDPGMGAFNVRDLTYKFRRVLEEKQPPLNGFECFPVNSEVPPGALSYEQSRTYSTGEAVVYRGGSGADIPEVGIGKATFTHPVVYLASRATIDWLENLRINMTGLDTQARKMRAARRVLDELQNRWIWSGSTAHGLYGVLNHPYVDTALSTVDYGTAASDDVASDFGDWANYAENESGSTFQPNALAIAPKLYNKLANRRYGDNADKSLLDWILSANPHITTVKKVRELNDAGGTDVHAMFFFRTGGASDASAEIVSPMGPTLLTPDRRALVTEMFMVAGFGGVNHRETGDNLVVYVPMS